MILHVVVEQPIARNREPRVAEVVVITGVRARCEAGSSSELASSRVELGDMETVTA